MDVIKTGARVRQVVPAIEGEVTARRFDEESGGMEYEVSYQAPDGEPHVRWFKANEVETMGEEQPQ